jgi:adenylate cyclase
MWRGIRTLMGADEEATLERLKALRRELLDPKIAEHHGRIVKTTGDGMLVEFASVVDAVRCAVEVQEAMAEGGTGVAADKRIELRMGIAADQQLSPIAGWPRAQPTPDAEAACRNMKSRTR